MKRNPADYLEHTEMALLGTSHLLQLKRMSIEWQQKTTFCCCHTFMFHGADFLVHCL